MLCLGSHKAELKGGRWDAFSPGVQGSLLSPLSVLVEFTSYDRRAGLCVLVIPGVGQVAHCLGLFLVMGQFCLSVDSPASVC